MMDLHHISFNQTSTHFTVCTDKGFFIFSMNPFKVCSFLSFLILISTLQLRIKHASSSVCSVQMNYDTNHVAFVVNDHLTIFDVNKKEAIKKIPEHRDILGVRFTSNYLLLIFDGEIDVYVLDDYKKYHTFETRKNRTGLCAVSEVGDVVVVPHKNEGSVKVCFLEDKTSKEIKAHESSIRCVSLNQDGSLVATASKKGTLIRIFDTKTQKPYSEKPEVRRGAKNAEMYSIAFAKDSKDLCCYSSSGKVHLWSLEKNSGKANRKSKMRMLSYLGFSYLGGEWSNSESKLGEGEGIVTFGEQNNIVYVLTNNGAFKRIEFGKEKQPVEKVWNVFDAITEASKPRPQDLEFIQRRFPNSIPVMVDRKDEKLKALPKRKFLAPKDYAVSDFGVMIAEKLGLGQKKTVALEVGEEMLKDTEEKMNDVYKRLREQDGYLYVKYSY